MFRNALAVENDRICVAATATPLGNVPRDLFTLLEVCLPHVFAEAETMTKDALRAYNGGGGGEEEDEEEDDEEEGGITGVKLAYFLKMLKNTENGVKSVILEHIVARKERTGLLLQRSVREELRQRAWSNMQEPLPPRTHHTVRYELTTEQETKIKIERNGGGEPDESDDDGEPTNGKKNVFSRANAIEMHKVHPALRASTASEADSAAIPSLTKEDVNSFVVDNDEKTLLYRVRQLVAFERQKERPEGAGGGGLVIFSSLLAILDIVDKLLADEDVPRSKDGSLPRIHGGVPMRERTAIERDFNAESRWKIMLCAPAGMEAINLQTADAGLLLTGVYNPERQRQAFGRIYRLKQRLPVRTYVLENEDKLADVKGALIQNKRRFAEALDMLVDDAPVDITAQLDKSASESAADAAAPAEEEDEEETALAATAARLNELSLDLAPVDLSSAQPWYAPHPRQLAYDRAQRTLESAETIATKIDNVMKRMRLYLSHIGFQAPAGAGAHPILDRKVQHGGRTIPAKRRKIIDRGTVRWLRDVWVALPGQVRSLFATLAEVDKDEPRLVEGVLSAASSWPLGEFVRQRRERRRAVAAAAEEVEEEEAEERGNADADLEALVVARLGFKLTGDPVASFSQIPPTVDIKEKSQPSDDLSKLFLTPEEIKEMEAEAAAAATLKQVEEQKSARFRTWLAAYNERIEMGDRDDRAKSNLKNALRTQYKDAFMKNALQPQFDYLDALNVKKLNLEHPTGHPSIVVQSDPLWKAEIDGTNKLITFTLGNGSLNEDDWSDGGPLIAGLYKLCYFQGDGAETCVSDASLKKASANKLTFNLTSSAAIPSDDATLVYRMKKADKKE